MPFAIERFGAVTAIETSAAGVTVRFADPLTAPDTALILLVPTPAAVTNPPAVIVATPMACELQVTRVVRFCVELSVYVPVAVNCSDVPFAIERFGAVTAIETSAAGVTVRFADPLTAPDTALILLVPTPAAVTNPPAVIVATPAVCELQVTEPVRFCVELSENVPVAVNCSDVPFAIERFAAVTAIETSVAEVTVRFADPVTAPDTALILLVPALAAVTNPPAVIVATAML